MKVEWQNLWEKLLALLVENGSVPASQLLTRVLALVAKNAAELRSVADAEILGFVTRMESPRFVVGTAGTDVGSLAAAYQRRTPTSPDQVWQRILELVFELAAYDSQQICPECRGDSLRILTDLRRSALYRCCDSCMWTESQGQIMRRRPAGLVPADRDALEKGGILIS